LLSILLVVTISLWLRATGLFRGLQKEKKKDNKHYD